MRTVGRVIAFMGMAFFLTLTVSLLFTPTSGIESGVGFVFLFLLLQALVFGFFTGWIADQKGRSNFNWFCLGFYFSFFALIAVAAAPRVEDAE